MATAWRLYLDTSVFGGVFDVREGFDKDSRRVFDAVLAGRAILLYSAAIERELYEAPEMVRRVFLTIPEKFKESVPISKEVVELSSAYMAAGIVSPKWVDDTLHIAAATVANADAIISWNFKHMVRLDRIKEYNRVNAAHGYRVLTILSPKEVDFDA